MNDKDETKPAAGQPGVAVKARKAKEDARLAAALRANLARRKQQTRDRSEDNDSEG